MRARSPANSADSSPPSPDLISMTTSSPSCGSRGTSSWRQPRLQLGEAGGELVGLLGERRVLDGELAGGGEVGTDRLQLARRPDDLAQLGVAPPQLAGLARVGVHGGVGERALQLGVLHEQRVDGRRGHSVLPPDT